MNIAICDDELNIRNQIKEALTAYFDERLINAEIYCFESGEALINSQIDFELAFLDVEMPDIDGIEAGKQIKKRAPNAVIIIVTAHSNFLDDALELGVYRFLSKPIDIARLYRSLDAALQSISSREIKVLCSDNEATVITVNSIMYCENYGRKTKIVTTDGELISKERLDFWKDKLNELNFFSPHASFIINFNYIKRFNRNSLTLGYSDKNIEISIAPKKQKEFRRKMFLFMERGM